MALLGLGPWGRNILTTLAGMAATDDAPVSLVAAIDPAPGARALAAERATGAPVFDDPRRAFEGDVDAVVVATPPETHADVAVAALRAGKHALVEKPFATTLADAERIVHAAKQVERHVMAGHLMRFHPAIQAMKAAIDGGAIGSVTGLFSRKTGCRGQGRLDPWWAFAPHDVSVARYLLGVDPRLVGMEARPGADKRDLLVTRLEVGAITAELELGHGARSRETWVVGQRGALHFDGEAARLVPGGGIDLGALPTMAARHVGRPLDPPHGEAPLARQFTAFLGHLAAPGPARHEVDEALVVQRVLDDGVRWVRRLAAVA